MGIPTHHRERGWQQLCSVNPAWERHAWQTLKTGLFLVALASQTTILFKNMLAYPRTPHTMLSIKTNTSLETFCGRIAYPWPNSKCSKWEGRTERACLDETNSQLIDMLLCESILGLLRSINPNFFAKLFYSPGLVALWSHSSRSPSPASPIQRNKKSWRSIVTPRTVPAPRTSSTAPQVPLESPHQNGPRILRTFCSTSAWSWTWTSTCCGRRATSDGKGWFVHHELSVLCMSGWGRTLLRIDKATIM